MQILLIFCISLPFVCPRLAPCAVDKGPLPKSVVINNCDNEEDCEFSRGKSVLGDFEFVAGKF